MIRFEWVLQMAWRDGRRNFSRLLLFSLSIMAGIAALVAIRSFGNNLRQEINDQSRELLGADLVISATQAPTSEEEKILLSIGKEISREISFSSMVLFPSGATRLCQIRAVDARYPYYGNVETTKGCIGTHELKQGIVIPEQILRLQFGFKTGQFLKIGDSKYQIACIATKVPGQSAITSGVAPLVFIPYASVNATGLLQKGSRVLYRFYYKFPAGTKAAKVLEQYKPMLEKAHFRSETVQSTQARTSEAYGNLGQYMNLVAFIALLLGSIGVYSSVLIYVKEKIPSVSILRCLGVNSWETFAIYLVQVFFLGMAGAMAGAFLGVLIQYYLPVLFQEFITVEVIPQISFLAIAEGLAAGTIMALLFGIIPLLRVLDVSPLSVLRSSFQEIQTIKLPLYIAYSAVIIFLLAFAYWQILDIFTAAIFTAGVSITFILLAAVGWTFMYLLRRTNISFAPFVFRQGISNLFRPDNQTIVMIVSIGLGTALIGTLYLVQRTLISKVTLENTPDQPNLIVFDVQPAQKEGVVQLTRTSGLPVLQTVPIVTMRLEAIGNKSRSQLEKDSSLNIPKWIFNREYRVTFRDSLTSSEKLVEGKWFGPPFSSDTIPVSVEEGWIKAIHGKLGDHITFNVQGAMFTVRIASVRKVDWKRIQTNFLIVFPGKVLEDAPKFFVVSTRTPDKKSSADFQNKLISTFSNVSVIDLTDVLKTLNEILGKISNVIRFLAFFSIATGIIVIIGSVRMSRYQRMKESVLLRTLGAGRKDILLINFVEYLLLGFIGTTSGILFAFGAGWAFSRFILEGPFVPDWGMTLVLEFLVPVITAFMGMLNIRSILAKTPLEILREQ